MYQINIDRCFFYFLSHRKKSPNQIRIQSKWVRAKKKIVRKIRRMKKIEVYWIEEPDLSVQAYTVHTVIQYFAYFGIVSLSSSVSFISIVLIFSSCLWFLVVRLCLIFVCVRQTVFIVLQIGGYNHRKWGKCSQQKCSMNLLCLNLSKHFHNAEMKWKYYLFARAANGI